MNNAMTISITCKDEATKARYMDLAARMEADTEFKASLKQCKTEASIYDLYKKNGYTDLSLETFKNEFKAMIDGIINVQPKETFELSEDELENVVGGYDLFSVITSAIDAIPVAGPLIAGIARGIKAGIEGKGASEVVKQIGVGVGLMLADAAISIATLGAGEIVTTGMKVGFAVGMGAMEFVKAGISEALSE